MKQESKKDIVRRLTESLNAQQQSVPQLPAQARARKIRVLGAKTDPQHPFAGYAVGADESVEENLEEAVGGNYLYHATGGLKNILASDQINAARGPQSVTNAQTKFPTVSVTRDWNYAVGGKGTTTPGLERAAIIVLDRNAVESNFKTLGTSQSREQRGLATPQSGDIRAGKTARDLDVNKDNILNKKDADEWWAQHQAGKDIFGQGFMPRFGKLGDLRANIDQAITQAADQFQAPKRGGEFEEAIVVPKGSMPIKGTMVGFYIPPSSPLMKDPEIMNDPRRLDLAKGGTGRFVKAAQQQGLAEVDFNPGRRGFLKKAGAVAATAAMPTGLAGAAAKAMAPAASIISAPFVGLAAIDLDEIINLLDSADAKNMRPGHDPYDLDIMKSIAQDAARESWGNAWFINGNTPKAFLDAVELGRKNGMSDQDIIDNLKSTATDLFADEMELLKPEDKRKVQSQSLRTPNVSEPAASPTTGMSGLARAAGAQIGRTMKNVGKATANTVLNQPARDMGRIEPTAAPAALPAPSVSPGMQIPKQKSRVAASPFNDDHSELDQFVKEEFNRHPDDINEESGAVVAHGYAYNRQDQRVAWTREFASEAAAKEWARRRNATVLSIVPKPVNENNPAAAWPEFDTVKTYESQLAEAKQRLAEAESRYVLYFNGKPASHYATEAEAKRIADSIKAKHPTVKIEIKNEMREGNLNEVTGDLPADTMLSNAVASHTFADTGDAFRNGQQDAMNFRPKNDAKYIRGHKYRSNYSDGYKYGLTRQDRSINPKTGQPYVLFGPNGPTNDSDPERSMHGDGPHIWVCSSYQQAKKRADDWGKKVVRAGVSKWKVVPKDDPAPEIFSESDLNEVTGDLPFDTMLSKIVAGGNLQTLAAKIVAKIKKFPQHVESDGYERDMPRYPDGHFYGADVLNDTFDEVMQQWKKMGPDNFSDEYGEESLFDVLDGSADYTRFWDGILKLRDRLQSMPGALEQLGKMVWHGLFSGSVEKGITDIGRKGVAEADLLEDNTVAKTRLYNFLKKYHTDWTAGKFKQMLDDEVKPYLQIDIKIATNQIPKLLVHFTDETPVQMLADYMHSSWLEDEFADWMDIVGEQYRMTGSIEDMIDDMAYEQGLSEGAKVDRMVRHIASSEKATGKSKKDAESIAWATANKRGMLDNKNKKKHVAEAGTPADIRAKNRAVVKKIQGKEADIDEGWKSKLAGAALAGAAALGGGAQAQTAPATGVNATGNNSAIVQSLVNPVAQQRFAAQHADTTAKLSDPRYDHNPNALSQHAAYPKELHNQWIENVRNAAQFDNPYQIIRTALNMAGLTPQEVLQNLPKGYKLPTTEPKGTFVPTGTPVPASVKEDITQEDIITKLKAKLGDYLSDLGQQIKKDPALQDKLSAETPDDQVGPPVKTLTTDDGHEISIHGNEDDGFRISIKNKQTPSKFDSLDEAVMACEMYRAHRRRQALNADYVEEA